MACSGCQFGLCRQFTYRTIIPPTMAPPCHLQPWNRIHVPFFPFTRISTEHETSFHVRISPGRQWPDRMDKSSPRTILMGLYELPAGQLGTAPSSSGICIQQRRECNHWHLPILCEQGLPPETVDEPVAPSSSSEAQCYMADLDQLHSQLKVSIAEAQECYQKAVDCQWMPSPAFRIGDHVYVKVKFFHTT